MNNLYELTFEEGLTDGVYSLSLVGDPAIAIEALKFNKDKKLEDLLSVKLESEDKRILVSPVLIPNQKIYRNNINGEEGYVYVTEDTIEKLQLNYFKHQYNHNSSLEHIHPIEGVFIFESWIIEDVENDKAVSLGFSNLPKGTWMIKMRVENEDLWNNYIRTGRIKGISIDALLQPVKIKESINKLTFKKEKMNKSNFKIAFKKALISKLGFNAELIEVKISDEISYFVEALELGKILFDKDNTALPNAEFTYDGMVYKTDAEGAIDSIEEVIVNDETEEFEFNDELNEVVAEVIEELKVEVIDEKDSMIAELEAKVLELEAKLAVLEQAETEKVELSKQTPASKGIKPTIKNDNKHLTGVLGAMRANR